MAWLCAASKQHTYEACVPFDKRGAERLPFDKSRPSSETEGLEQMWCRVV